LATGVLRLPLIVVVENNEWAISVPFEKASATPTVAERAPAWAAWGTRVDGNDVEAVAGAFSEAIERARSGGGPALIEATCYRFRGHFEGDADTYRTQEEKEARRAIDPLVITRNTLVQRGLATQSQLDHEDGLIRGAIAELLESVRSDSAPDASTATRHVFVEAS